MQNLQLWHEAENHSYYNIDEKDHYFASYWGFITPENYWEAHSPCAPEVCVYVSIIWTHMILGLGSRVRKLLTNLSSYSKISYTKVSQ